MNQRETKKTYLQSMRRSPPPSGQLAVKTLVGLGLTPLYWLLSYRFDVPGRSVRRKCVRLALRLLVRARSASDLRHAFLMLLYPLDSTRYFELEFAWLALTAASFDSYLDVSSPRVFFTLLLAHDRRLTANLVNPDNVDLADTKGLLQAAGFLSRCRLHDCLIANASFAPKSFDVITSISVVEHIQDDHQAIRKMWALLEPGGRLILTVPCAALALEQFLDRDEYALHGNGTDGPIFWQRFYDSRLLEERIFSTTGEPRRSRIFGERRAGLFLANATQKRTDRFYPFWREPYMVGEEYTYFDSIEALPGEGVIAMEFVKT